MNTCISPEEIEAWELEAYLYGRAPARVVQHVARCPACSARVNELRDFHRRLQGALARVDCPPAEALLQHRWRQLPLDRTRKIDVHLANCAACRTEYAAFAGPEPGPVQQFLAGVRQRWGLLTATLQPSLTLAPARRGTETPPTIYRVPETDWEIVLTQTTGARGYVLSGQLLGADPEDLVEAQAGILADDELLLETTVDPTGWFALQPLPTGRYTLWIDVAAAHIRAPEVVVGPEPTAPC
jgi:hypothetical protein